MGIVRSLVYNASMQWTVVGLGNPDKEYQGTRHNIGKEFAAALAPKLPKSAKVAELNVYMNASGSAIKKFSPKKLIVLHDDLDLSAGSVKISFGSGSGGHKGVESIVKALKTKDFIRIRIGISPSTSSGRLRRPESQKIGDFVLGKFRPPELLKLKKSKKLVAEALELIIEEGVERAQTEINGK